MPISGKHHRILLIGPRSGKHITGVSLAFELALEGFRKSNIPHNVVNIVFLGFAASCTRLGKFLRALETIAVVTWSWGLLPFCSIVYMTMSTSKAGFLRDFLVINAASLFGKPVYLHLHGAGFTPFFDEASESFKNKILNTLAKVQRLIVLAEPIKEQFNPVLGYQEKVAVVPNGLPLDVPAPPAQAKSYRTGDTFRILFLSSMMPSKGYKELLMACKQIKNSGRLPIHCHFCGNFLTTRQDETAMPPQQLEEDFLNEVEHMGLKGCITWHGQVNGYHKIDRLKKAHVMVLPSWHPWEGQPLCIIEAMAFNTPVITTRHNVLSQIVQHGRNGLLVEKRNVKDLGTTIIQMANDPVAYSRMSTEARNSYDRHFSREKFWQNLFGVLFGTTADTEPFPTTETTIHG